MTGLSLRRQGRCLKLACPAWQQLDVAAVDSASRTLGDGLLDVGIGGQDVGALLFVFILQQQNTGVPSNQLPRGETYGQGS
jgi:hypothetical protein